MRAIKVMVNGVPGNMAKRVANQILADGRFQLVPYSLTGPEIRGVDYAFGAETVALVHPEEKNLMIKDIQEEYGEFISLDFTHPSAVNSNAEFYCERQLPFVMGTTGGDRKLLIETVEASLAAAVIAPNMAKQVVGLQAMMEYAAANFPGLFAGYSLQVWESHQQSKADPSGTAIAMVKYFRKLGIEFSDSEIAMERDPEVQRTKLGVDEQYLGGHGWHNYTVVSPDGTVELGFTHNLNGRDAYVAGALDAIVFLDKQVGRGVKGKVFTMIDVLKG